MRRDIAHRSDFLAMFLNEARIAARMHHPNIVPVHDLGFCEGVYFIAMEYVTGRTVRQILERLGERERAPLWFALRVVAAVAAALQHVHDLQDEQGAGLGLVHCDVSPENIMVSFAATPALLDFGIATETARGSSADGDAFNGKLHYIAPEGLRGLALDRRADVYGLGVVLYELLAGECPFRGVTRRGVLTRIAAGEKPPLRAVAPDVPNEVVRIVERAMANERAARYPQAADFVFDIAELLAITHDDCGERELGLYVGSRFPDATDIPADVQRELRERHGASPTGVPSSRRIPSFTSVVSQRAECEAPRAQERGRPSGTMAKVTVPRCPGQRG